MQTELTIEVKQENGEDWMRLKGSACWVRTTHDAYMTDIVKNALEPVVPEWLQELTAYMRKELPGHVSGGWDKQAEVCARVAAKFTARELRLCSTCQHVKCGTGGFSCARCVRLARLEGQAK